MTWLSSRLTRRGVAGAFSLCLSAAASAAGPNDAIAAAQAAYLRGDYAAAASAYEAIAAQASANFAPDYWLLAAEAAIRARQPAHAGALLDRLDLNGLDTHQQSRVQLLRAQIMLSRGDRGAAAQALAQLPADETQSAAALYVQAQLRFAQGDAYGATRLLEQRETLLVPAEIERNRDAIWSGLQNAPLNALKTPAAANDDAIARGWLQLALLARSAAPLAAYEDWRTHFPGHPASERLANLLITPAPAAAVASDATPAQADTSASAAPQAQHPTPLLPPGAAAAVPPAVPAAIPAAATGIAANTGYSVPSVALGQGETVLLLPLSGGLSVAGTVVRDAYTASQAAHVEDTNGTPTGAAEAYRRAQGDGASLAVGPLRKEDVTAVLSSAGGSLPLPLLALNYVDGLPPAGLYQFGLAPEDEAVAAAKDAAAHGLRRAIALVPDGDRGDRVLAAFTTQLGATQGSVVASARYSPGTLDFSGPIKTLLKIDASQARARAVQNTAGLRLETNLRRRDDVDLIFLAANAAQARLIAAQFRYFRAENLPIYGTASFYDGSVDADLEGLRFCDIPALTTAPLVAGQTVDRVRLAALGSDAALLAQALREGHLGAGTRLSGATGVLEVDAAGIIHRQLGCAQFSGGAVQPIAAPPSSALAP